MSSTEPSTQPIKSEAIRTGAPSLYTIGYGARTLDEFVTALRAHRIEYVIDVRTAPFSKFKPEFTKEWLQNHVERQGIRDLFMGDTLGGQPKDPCCHTDGKVDYDKVRTQAFFQAGLERLKKAFAQQRRVALMCSEGRPEQCHRSKLIVGFPTELDRTYTVEHRDTIGPGNWIALPATTGTGVEQTVQSPINAQRFFRGRQN